MINFPRLSVSPFYLSGYHLGCDLIPNQIRRVRFLHSPPELVVKHQVVGLLISTTRVCHVPVWCRMIDLTERPYKPRTDSVSIPLSVLTTTENNVSKSRR